VKAAREEAAARARVAEAAQKVWDRAETGWKLQAGQETRTLQAEAEKLLRAKVDAPGRVDPEIRLLARQFLHSGIALGNMDRLAGADRRLGELLGLQRKAGAFMGRLGEGGDPMLLTVADQTECAAWRAALARIGVLAGEVE